jgi:hypothetical protein
MFKCENMTQTHLIEDEEGGLMMIESTKFKTFPRSGKFKLIPISPAMSSTQATAATLRDFIHLVEEKVFAQIGEGGNTSRWVIDTGATNHMPGAYGAFSELDTNVRSTVMFGDGSVVRIEGCSTVMFGDGSVVRIEGCSTVIFSCKNGEHRSFSDIYYIPKHKANIISVGAAR